MVIIILLILLSLFVFALTILKKNDLIKLVFIIYSLMIFFSIILGLTSDEYSLFDETISYGLIYFSLCLLLILLPFFNCSYNKDIPIIYIPSNRFLVLVNWIFIILSFISVVHFSSVIYKVLTSDKLEILRHILATEGHPYIDKSFVNTLSGVVATFYTFTLYLFFVNIVRSGSKFVSVSLFVGSFSYPTFVFSYFGRDGFIFWVLSFFSLYLIFSEFLDTNLKNKINRIFQFFVVFFLIVFLFISFARFENLDNVLNFMLIYLGQQPYIFAEIFNFELTPRLGASSFPLIFDFIGDNYNSDTYLNELGSKVTLSWQFGTLLKEFYFDFGTIGNIVFLMLFFLLFSFFFVGKRANLNFFKLFLFFAYTQVIIQGVFYFRQYNDVGNLYLISLILLALSYRFIPCSKIVLKCS